MKLKDKLQFLEGSYVAVNLTGSHTMKGKLEAVEEDFIILKVSGGSEAFVPIEKVASILETL